jgi:transcriptional regulator with XRE-family HTH domain
MWMGTPHRVPRRRRQLGALLTKLRVEAGLTQAEVARRLECTDSTISRIECGQPPNIHLMRAMLDLYTVTVDRWKPIEDMLAHAKEKGWWHAYRLEGTTGYGYVPIEAEASRVRSYQLALVPGLLQTEAYMRAVFAVGHQVPIKQVNNEIAARLKRQERLFGDDPLTLHVVLDESLLWRGFEWEVMCAQLAHIAEMAELPNVTVQVIPSSVGPHEALGGMFAVLGFPEPHEPDVAYVEHTLGSVHIEKPDEVRQYKRLFDRLSALALDPAASVALVAKVASEL